ncbi:MAG TPA: hypothetical protein VMV10_29635 [Pirellulales bacterium]|nr:hypothetical protein [Pirellulales bacterium]
MKLQLDSAWSKTAVISVAVFCAWLYRSHAIGRPFSSKRAIMVAALILTAAAITRLWQATSKAKNWSWWTTFFAFILSTIVVAFVTLGVFQILF